MQQIDKGSLSYSDIFELRAEDYHTAMTRYPAARAAEFLALVDFACLQPSSVIADIPSGGGYLESYIDDVADAIVAVEPSEQFYSRCKETQRLNKVFSPLEELAIDDQAVDSIVSLAGLHHVIDRLKVFREFHRILKPSGTLCIGDVRLGSNVDRFLNVFVHEHNSLGHEGWFIDSGFRQTLTQAGFDIENRQVIPYRWSFSGKEQMAEFCILMFGLDKATPEIVLAAIEQYLGYSSDESGYHMNWELEFLRCRHSL
ncbi:MAG: class I SAM-dependent methyltransferase [Gammaproteobacteria bacterium]|nr:class I SAM-dependent methyltransferase [Gammaproteobacteria bacterium]